MSNPPCAWDGTKYFRHDELVSLSKLVAHYKKEFWEIFRMGLNRCTDAGKNVGNNEAPPHHYQGDNMKTETTTNETESVTLSRLIDTLTRGTRMLAEYARQLDGTILPQVLVTVARDENRKGSGLKLGHITTMPAWESNEGEGFLELLITGEGLTRGGRAVFGTLAHEMSHAYNIAKGIKDTDSNGRHNKKFKDTAERVYGLEISNHKAIGWSLTEVPDTTAELWAGLIADIDNAITAVAGGLKSAPKTKKRNKNLLKATCQCPEPLTIRASAKVIESGVRCDECEELFKAEETEEEGED